MMQRYTRQIRLYEVGEVGQASLLEAAATVAHAGIGGEFEARYLAGAGVGHIRCAAVAVLAAASATNSSISFETASRPVSIPTEQRVLADDTADQALRGALRALRFIRSQLR